MRWLVFSVLLGAVSLGGRNALAQVRFEGQTRACAGGIDDATHTVSLKIQSGQETPTSFRLEGESGGASIVTTAPRLLVRSGPQAATPFLVALQNEKEVGRVQLDFAPATPYRRFSYPFDISDYVYTAGGFLIAADGVHGKIYLKFRRSENRGDVNGNWVPVAGHRLRLRVRSVEQTNSGGKTFSSPQEVARFGRVFNPAHPKAPDCLVTTRKDGTAKFEIEYFKPSYEAAPYDYNRNVRFDLAVDDLTAPPSPDYASPNSPTIQSVPATLEAGDAPHWFDWPSDLSLRLLWEATPKNTKGTSQWRWCDLLNGVRQEEHGLQFETSVTDDWDDGHRGVRLSPDGSRALFLRGRSGQYLDTCHDTLLTELSSGRVFGWHDYLFGTSETWDTTSSRVAFVNGSLDTIFGEAVASPLTLCIRDAKLPAPDVMPHSLTVGALDTKDIVPEQEAALRTDNNLDRESLAWMPGGQLLAGTTWMHWTTPDHMGQPTSTPLLLHFPASGGAGKPWQSYAWAPVVAPDGRHVAFKGYEQSPDGDWRDTSTALCVCDADGRHRRTLTRLGSDDLETNRFVFSADSRFVLVCEGKSICRYDVATGARREVVRLNQGIDLVGMSRNGLYLLSNKQQFWHSKGRYGLAANSLYAIRLSDGQLLPLVTFGSEMAFAAL